MSKFSYLSEKVKASDFIEEPFKHIVVEDFFSEEHFDKIVNSPQIGVRQFRDNQDVVDGLMELGYAPQPFPGCITDVSEYIAFADGKKKLNRDLIKGYGKHVIEGYGLTMRLKDIRDDFLQELIDYLNADEFQTVLAEKFGLTEEVEIETAYQKNLMHYEISPHCDTSRKALTYMVNIYNVDDCEHRDMHTHLLEFNPEYRYLYEVWKTTDFDPVWVPWDWCKTIKRTNTNNSISIFRPAHDTLHAVRVSEPHLTHQRNQIYGNLWYPEGKKNKNKAWQDLDLINETFMSRGARVKSHLKEAVKAVLRG